MTAEKPSALDALLTAVPGIDPKVVESTRKAVAILSSLGLLSSEPTETYRPFNRDAVVGSGTAGDASWTPARRIQLAKN